MNFSDVAVVYGSQTGTAYDLAIWISKQLGSAGISASCVSGNDLHSKLPLQKWTVCIFLVATAGNGDFPINFRRFEEHIFGPGSLSGWHRGTHFAVFGLGDSKYSQYNYASRMLYGRLLKLGATPLVGLGCGDDQSTLGYAQEFIPWFRELWHVIVGENYGDIPRKTIMAYSAQESTGGTTCLESHFPANFGKIISNIRITSRDHFQDVRKIRLRVMQSWSFAPGDVVSVYPSVDAQLVCKFIREILLDVPERVVVIIGPAGTSTFEGTISLRKLFSDFLDITAVPGQYFYEVMFSCYLEQLNIQESPLTEEQGLIRDKLSVLSSLSPEGVFERLRYSGKEKLSIHEVLWDFRCVSVPLPYLIDCVPPIAPRYYSLSSLPIARECTVPILMTPTVPVSEVELIVAVSSSTTLFGRSRKGLASNYLAGLQSGAIVPGRVRIERGFGRKNQLEAIRDAKTILLFATGTGVAPAKALIESLSHEKRIILFAGFRHPNSDLLIDSLCVRCKCFIAWSRPLDMSRDHDCFCWSEVAEGVLDDTVRERLNVDALKGRKTWIQDLIPIHADLVRECLVSEDTVVMISGRSHPTPDQVVEALEKCVGTHRITSLKSSDKLVFDTWG